MKPKKKGFLCSPIFETLLKHDQLLTCRPLTAPEKTRRLAPHNATTVTFAPKKRVHYFQKPTVDKRKVYYNEQELIEMAKRNHVHFADADTIIHFEAPPHHLYDKLYYSDFEIKGFIDEFELECLLEGDAWVMEYQAIRLA